MGLLATGSPIFIIRKGNIMPVSKPNHRTNWTANTQKLWRKMSQKTTELVKEAQPNGFVIETIRETRHGRQLRNALRGTNHPALPTDTIAFMMKRAGIDTPNFDKALAMGQNVHTQAEDRLSVGDGALVQPAAITVNEQVGA
jgi:hypothetical protein